MVFIGVNSIKPGMARKQCNININTDFIRLVNEDDMTITLDDGSIYRIDEESLDIFLAAIYGDRRDIS
jgi:hypothetical protein